MVSIACISEAVLLAKLLMLLLYPALDNLCPDPGRK